LPLAVSILIAGDQLVANTDGIVFLGELALDGELRPVTGILPIMISAKAKGYTKFIVPKGNANEASYIEGTEVYALESLRETVDFLAGEKHVQPVKPRSFKATQSAQSYNYDLSFVKGQKVAKRALEIAVAGGHNILLAGPPGTGKTLLARCIPTIMPDMTFEEALEVTKIHSISGELSDEGIVSLRPFRTPHHTATTVSLCGGGNTKIHAGEISKAHKGVLFLDELPEYTRHALESLRQPLEDRVITVTRAGGAITFPADFMLCASMNPCPCGNYGSAYLTCTCTPSQIHKYRSKVSGPLLDRIDLQVEVDGVQYDDLVSEGVEETSAQVKKRVECARAIQRERFIGDNMTVNANMGEKQIKKYCKLSRECEDILRTAFETLHLSARARSRIIKVARTIADLDMSADIRPEHILEASSYRSYESNSI
jgi:magnesium chelatase family protein